MKRILLLSLFPGLGLLCLALAWQWSRIELPLALAGGGADGVIRATVKSRATGRNDLVTDLDHSLTLTFGDGAKLRVKTRNYDILSLGLLTDGTESAIPLSALETAAGPHPRIGPDLKSIISEILRGDQARIQRVLQRESTQPASSAILEIQKDETAHGWFGLSSVPRAFVVEADALRPLSKEPLPPPGKVFTTATFSQMDRQALRSRKGDTLIHYQRLVEGTEAKPYRQDFILYDEPYSTEFLPVYQYKVAGKAYASLAQIGRKGAPFSGFILQAPCRVAYVVNAPETSILLPYLASPSPGASRLNWFSNFCESLFSRWAYLAVFLLFAGIFLVVGALIISLHLHPAASPVTTTHENLSNHSKRF